MPTLALVITSRPSYARLKTLILALQAQADVRLLVTGAALLDRYGSVVEVIERECGPVAWKAWTVFEGETHETTARTTAATLLDLSTALRMLAPDAVIVHADRHEVLGAAMAARYQEIPLIHLQGGEQTGSIDDRVRDAITQLADWHLVSTPQAALRVAQMREGAQVRVTGCPSLDVARAARNDHPVTALGGDGVDIDLSRPFLVVLQHPVSDHADHAADEMGQTLGACAAVGLPAVVFWPGNEAGADGVSKAIRLHRDRFPMRTVRNMPPEAFLRLLTQASCLVGNSSVGIREAGYLGVPVVNIGDRQAHRERAGNVLDVTDSAKLTDAITAQLWHGPYLPSTLYGDGHSGARMAEAITGLLRGVYRGVETTTMFR